MTPGIRVGIDGRELVGQPCTGIRRYLLAVIEEVRRTGWDCRVYVDGTVSRASDALDGTVTHIDRGWTQWWDQVRLPRQLRQDRITVFLSPFYKAPLVAPCPVVLTIHDLFFIGYPGRARPIYDATATMLARLYASRAAAVIADSSHSKASITRRLRVAPGKIHVIPVALAAHFRPVALPGIADRYGISTPYVLYVGNFKPHKNVGALVCAYAALPAKLQTGHTLVLAGSDVANRPAVERAVRAAGLGHRVVFTGAVDDADLPAIYSGASVFVLPSLEEGFGLPALEAMACGTPVIAANRAAIPEVVGSAGILVDVRDTHAFATAIARVLSDRELAGTLRARGLQRAATFTRDATAGTVVTLLGAVARRRRGADV